MDEYDDLGNPFPPAPIPIKHSDVLEAALGNPAHLQAAIASQKAYQDSTHVFEDSEALVEYAPRDGGAYPIVAFRGTSFNGKRLLADIMLDAAAYPSSSVRLGRVHCGFYKGAAGLMAKMLPDLEATCKVAPPVLCGHSKGAAEALMVSLLMRQFGLPVQEVVLFGCPRAGLGQGYLKALNLCPTITRYIYGSDIVTHVPTMLPWRHPDEFSSALGNWRSVKVGEASRPWPNVWDHRIKNYVEALS